MVAGYPPVTSVWALAGLPLSSEGLTLTCPCQGEEGENEWLAKNLLAIRTETKWHVPQIPLNASKCLHLMEIWDHAFVKV